MVDVGNAVVDVGRKCLCRISVILRLTDVDMDTDTDRKDVKRYTVEFANIPFRIQCWCPSRSIFGHLVITVVSGGPPYNGAMLFAHNPDYKFKNDYSEVSVGYQRFIKAYFRLNDAIKIAGKASHNLVAI